MNIILFSHPAFINSQSMPRYAKWLLEGMNSHGHTAEIWTVAPLVYKLPLPRAFKKWLGYIDQYLIFPLQAKSRIKKLKPDTLFVLTDHALGPWLPLVKNRPHVVHCHDFLAQLSAEGLISQNKISKSGVLYQKMIRRGYQQGENFISVSKKTQADLHRFVEKIPKSSEVIYNGLTQVYAPGDQGQTRFALRQKTGINLEDGYLLHVGGNHWYKNRKGVIELYSAWRSLSDYKLPLILVGEEPDTSLMEAYRKSKYSSDIHFLSKKDDAFIRDCYKGATIFLFPSIAEGFGWPIVEAMASGCPTITINDAPMNEVGGTAAIYLASIPESDQQMKNWLSDSSLIIEKAITCDGAEKLRRVKDGLENASRFDSTLAIHEIENFYLRVLAHHQSVYS